MWKHEILETLKLLTPGDRPSTYSLIDDCNQLRPLIRDSVQFYFGKLNAFFDSSKGGEWMLDTIMRPPYPNTLLTWEADLREGQTTETNTVKAGALYIEHENGPMLFPMQYNYNYGIWTGYTTKAIFLDNLWKISFLGLQQDETLKHETLRSLVVTMKLLEILNARNIVTKAVVPPEKLNRKRIKHHHEPYDKYYILEVNKGVPKQKFQGEVPWDYRSPSNVAFHMCRGHFKEYTAEAPLFGKYVGKWWWQSQMRGSAENGTIAKDYSVTT